VGVPCGPIYSIDQVFADEQVKHLGAAIAGKKADGSEQLFVAQPFKMSRTPTHIDVVPPKQGEHTDEVLKDFGFSDAEIKELHEVKAV
jgi:crotonobetainyl-CoA:carnitine CoA-transferase CaiB-like acyl-CoA transferase